MFRERVLHSSHRIRWRTEWLLFNAYSCLLLHTNTHDHVYKISTNTIFRTVHYHTFSVLYIGMSYVYRYQMCFFFCFFFANFYSKSNSIRILIVSFFRFVWNFLCISMFCAFNFLLFFRSTNAHTHTHTGHAQTQQH